jgi:hypothetical protein
MKTLKFYGLLAIVMVSLTSCDQLFGTLPPENVVYNLGFCFQDKSGNDLIKGIGLEEWSPASTMEDALWGSVKSDLYVLDIIVSEPCSNWDNDIYNAPARPGFEPDVNRPGLSMNRRNDGARYLNNSLSIPVNDCPEEKTLTYKLKCPYIFGDNEIHEFVTYWDVPKKSSSSKYTEYYATCNRIVFDGEDITPQAPIDKSGDYTATIKLK